MRAPNGTVQDHRRARRSGEVVTAKYQAVSLTHHSRQMAFGPRLRTRASQPRPARPSSIIAHVEGSGTVTSQTKLPPPPPPPLYPQGL
jgi:hypothetical protein